MAGVYAKIPSNTFEHLGIDAAMLLTNFDPETGEYTEDSILGVTTGGSSINVSVDHIDYGEDIDNCPKNTKELMRVDNITAVASGTLVTFNRSVAERLMAHADWTSSQRTGHEAVYKITPRTTVNINKDFYDLWFVINYSNINTGEDAGFIAVHFKNVMSTGGFQMQTTEKAKTQWAFEFTAHFSIDAQDDVPYEVYVRQGADSNLTPEILLNRHSATIEVDEELQLSTMRKVPSSATITWSSSDNTKASVSAGKVTGEAAGSAIITASITASGVAYTDTCTVIVEAAS